MTTYAHGIHIAGVGDSTDFTDGTLWVTPAGRDLADGDPADYSVTVALDPESTQALNYATNPFEQGEGRVTSSAFRFRMPARDDLATRFLHVQHQTGIALNEDLTASETDIDLDLSNSSISASTLENSAIYVGDETIKLGSLSSGTYSSSTRGFWGSPSKPHDSGDNVYSSHEPHWDQREVTLYEIEVLGTNVTLSKRWQGYVDLSGENELGTREQGAGLEIPSSDETSKWGGVAIRQEPKAIEGQDKSIKTVNPGTASGLSNFYAGDLGDDGESHVYKTDTGSRNYVSNLRFIRLGDTVQLAQNDSLIFKPTDIGAPEPDLPGDKQSRQTNPADLETGPHEIFFVSKNLDKQTLSGITDLRSTTRELTEQPDDVQGVGISPSSKDRYPYHPLAIALSLEWSTDSTTTTPEEFDILQAPQWSIDRKDKYESGIVATAHTIIQETSDLQIDHLEIGFEPGPIEILKIIDRKLLAPFGFFRGLNDKGELTLSHVGLADVDDLVDASTGAFNAPVPAIPGPGESEAGPLSLTTGLSETVDAVDLKFGQRAWDENASHIYYRARDGDAVAPGSQQKPEFQLDLTTISSNTDAKRRAQRSALLQHFQTPILEFRAPPPERVSGTPGYSVGNVISIQDLSLANEWLVDSDGNRVNQLAKDAEFSALILGWRYNLESRTYRMRVMLTNFVKAVAVRLRAPSAVLIEVESGEPITKVWVGDSSEFDAPESDGLEFAVGDDIYFSQQDGKDVGTGPTREIGDIVDDNNTPNGNSGYRIELEDSLSGGDIPSKDQIMRFANFDDYSNPGHDGEYSTDITPIYVWLGESDGTLGSGDDDAAIYG